MKILPAVSRPPKVAIARRHVPRAVPPSTGYRKYRACLRWDFGFRCAFCLVHEIDLFKHGAEGMGLTTVEHFEPRSLAPELENDYANCFYACSLCNRSRSNLPRLSPTSAARLLDPTVDEWGSHFRIYNDSLLPEGSDANAEYTRDAYDLNEPRKVAMRQDRRENIEYCLRVLRGGPAGQRDLQEFVRRHAADPARTGDARRALELEQILQLTMQKAARDLIGYAAIPHDHDRTCRCKDTANHSLPTSMVAELLDAP